MVSERYRLLENLYSSMTPTFPTGYVEDIVKILSGEYPHLKVKMYGTDHRDERHLMNVSNQRGDIQFTLVYWPRNLMNKGDTMIVEDSDRLMDVKHNMFSFCKNYEEVIVAFKRLIEDNNLE